MIRRKTIYALVAMTTLSTFCYGALNNAAAEVDAATGLANTIGSGLSQSCAQSGSLSDMAQIIATNTSGVAISTTYPALLKLEANTGLCDTAKQAVALAKTAAVASICSSPTSAALFPELGCTVTGSVNPNGAQTAAAFLTGGNTAPTGSGY